MLQQPGEQLLPVQVPRVRRVPRATAARCGRNRVAAAPNVAPRITCSTRRPDAAAAATLTARALAAAAAAAEAARALAPPAARPAPARAAVDATA